MNKCFPLAAFALGWPLSLLAQTSSDTSSSPEAPVKALGVVIVEGSRPTSLPTQIPTTMEGITARQIEATVNATDSEDVLRYFPSLLVRKRYVGDYNHAILSSRASGTGNSARSAVYADGILLSNYLGNGVGGLSFPPRWGMVTPEEIERVDVMYGPFSAAYPGNSVGAVVDYITRMPRQFEAHAKVGYVVQPFEIYGQRDTFRAWQASASVGNRSGDWAWWINVNRTDSEGQPLTFATRTVSSGTVGSAGTPVTGAALDANNAGQSWHVLGAGTQYRTLQDHLKLKLAYDISPTLRATYVLGLWENLADGRSVSYLRDATGQAFYGTASSSAVNIGGRSYSLTGGDFGLTRENLRHTMQGLSIKSRTRGEWDWEAAASLYDYARDDKRQNGPQNFQPASRSGGAGTLAQGGGTGWNTLALKGTWRPVQADGAHIVDFGVQQERYTLRYRTSAITGDYLDDAPGALSNNVEGRTQLQSLYAQDTWRIAPDWRAVLGARAERWEASDGRTDFSASSSLSYPARSESFLSPKVAPYSSLTTNSQYINDPNLAPEKSWTAELSADRDLGFGNARLIFFAEDTRDALYSQTTFDAVANRNVSRVQNIGRIATTGIEAALSTRDWLIKGLELSGSFTYADSKIKENAGFVVTPGDTIGKWQPNIPRWRATAVASYRVNDRWTTTLAARYSGPQYRTLNNADVNGFTYMGVSKFAVVDARVLYRIDKQWSAAFGIDNLNNDSYWNFHPYPQRSYSAELKFDL